RLITLCLAAAIGLAATAALAAETYPTRPIRLVVPSPPGGTIDPISRVLAEAMSRRYGQNVVVDNRPGANFNVGMELVAKSPANGYTLVIASSGALATNIHLYRKLPFDPVKDFEPIVLYGNVP